MHVSTLLPYRLLHKYPGMRSKDEAIWDEFVRRHPGTFTQVYYNVHVGDPAMSEQKKTEMIASGYYDVTQWCVDALAFDGEKEYVIEIKPNAGPGSLGQVLAYKELLMYEGRASHNAVPVVVTDAISPIMEHAAALLHVQLLIP